MSIRKRQLQTPERMANLEKAKKETLREKEELRAREESLEDVKQDPKWLTGYMPGHLESRIAYALVEGFEDKNELADRFDVSRKKIASVEKKLRRLGYVREVVTRYKPPASRISSFRYQRLIANHPDGKDAPF